MNIRTENWQKDLKNSGLTNNKNFNHKI